MALQGLICKGDKTSHGGTVLSGSPHSDIDGRPIARQGDMVSCPACKGVFPIAQGDDSDMIDGAAAAYHGHKVACGASLIAGQTATRGVAARGTGPGGGQAASALAGEAMATLGLGEIGQGMMARYEEVARAGEEGNAGEAANAAHDYRGRFQVLEQESGKPLSGRQVRVRCSGGQTLIGMTDSEGCTEWVARSASEALSFELLDEDTA